MQMTTYALYGDKGCPSEGVASVYIKYFYDHDCPKEPLLNSC